MIFIINFGPSPFQFLFWLVAGILAATLAANGLAAVLHYAIEARTRHLYKQYEIHGNESK